MLGGMMGYQSRIESLAAAARAEIRGTMNLPVLDLAYDSRAVLPGTLFFCVPGGSKDGHSFATAAVERGAAALVVGRWLDLPVAQLKVPNVRSAMGPVAACFYAMPSERVRLAGVTGTNGKTTVAYLLERIFARAGLTAGMIGTVETRLAGEVRASLHTTPEALDLQRLLAEMADRGVEAVAMEVSSHGLDQGRVEGCRFDVAIFTNLTQDHLDYHGNMEAYFEAKARLFAEDYAEFALVNIDDPAGRELARRASVPVETLGLDGDADWRACDVELSAAGSRFVVSGPEGRQAAVQLRIPGRFNVSNCLAAVAGAHHLGVDLSVAAEAAGSLEGVPGRFQRVEAGQPFSVVVDYAHTPDGLERVLTAARELALERVIVVFGCGGDRDRGKRPLMGRAAGRLADLVVVTSDNPRSEDPLAIIAEIESGLSSLARGSYLVEPDRRWAIHVALEQARAGDTVVIAGKGHETGQQFADRTLPFDDRVVVAEEIGALGFQACQDGPGR